MKHDLSAVLYYSDKILYYGNNKDSKDRKIIAHNNLEIVLSYRRKFILELNYMKASESNLVKTYKKFTLNFISSGLVVEY